MANYVCTSRTNYFRVTDEEKYEALFSRLYCPDGDEISALTKTENGVTRHGFGSYGQIWYKDPALDEDEEDYQEDDCINMFLEELQKILPEDEAFILFEAGHTKLQHVSGDAIVATADTIEYVNLRNAALAAARKILGADFQTDCEY